MSFIPTLVVCGVATVMAGVALFLAMVRTGGDPAKLDRIPVRSSMAVTWVLCFVLLASQMLLSNREAVREATEQRAHAALSQLEAGAALEAGPDAGNPFADIAEGGNDWQDPALLQDLGSGKELQLRTASGKPAQLRLTALKGTNFLPVLTYDGVHQDVLSPASVEVRNTGGFPQVLAPKELPAAK